MEVSDIIDSIDAQISKLTEARGILAGISGSESTPTNGRGRPKGSKNVAPSAKGIGLVTKRQLSPEGRKRIADAMKRRWAERRKALAK